MSGAKVVTFYLIPNSYRLKSSFNLKVECHNVNCRVIYCRHWANGEHLLRKILKYKVDKSKKDRRQKSKWKGKLPNLHTSQLLLAKLSQRKKSRPHWSALLIV